MKIKLGLENLVALLICALLLGRSSFLPADQTARVRYYTRNEEFNFIGWTANALMLKLSQAALGTASYLSQSQQHQLVIEYVQLVQQISQLNEQINTVYATPNLQDPQSASAGLRQELARLSERLDQISPSVETILQAQVASVLAEEGLTLGGQPVPPVLYHVTPLPYALIVSPRDVIREEEDISLQTDLTIEQRVSLEDSVARGLDVSALVVPVGGIGIYPTMVMQTSDLPYLLETIAHEWTHNFLTLRPLGVSYEVSPALRTMNETTASISGKEVGMKVLERYYPELVPPPSSSTGTASAPAGQPAAPTFDFNAEMHLTRVTVDKLLADGHIQQAEAYMEAQRQVFWNHGYLIRKLNQAYFAFYGAYADVPQGAAGADPVGAAVRELRQNSRSLADFLNRISWVTSFSQLQAALK